MSYRGLLEGMSLVLIMVSSMWHPPVAGWARNPASGAHWHVVAPLPSTGPEQG